MNDKNIEIRQQYYTLLNGNVAYNGEEVPFFNGFVPGGYYKYYILLQSQNSTGRETKNDQDREMLSQFVISTRLDNNSGWECDKIAGQVLNLIYPTREANVQGAMSIDLVSDNTVRDYDPAAKKQIVERYITFRHIY